LIAVTALVVTEPDSLYAASTLADIIDDIRVVQGHDVTPVLLGRHRSLRLSQRQHAE
jgi:hypothetical protein